MVDAGSGSLWLGAWGWASASRQQRTPLADPEFLRKSLAKGQPVAGLRPETGSPQQQADLAGGSQTASADDKDGPPPPPPRCAPGGPWASPDAEKQGCALGHNATSCARCCGGLGTSQGSFSLSPPAEPGQFGPQPSPWLGDAHMQAWGGRPCGGFQLGVPMGCQSVVAGGCAGHQFAAAAPRGQAAGRTTKAQLNGYGCAIGSRSQSPGACRAAQRSPCFAAPPSPACAYRGVGRPPSPCPGWQQAASFGPSFTAAQWHPGRPSRGSPAAHGCCAHRGCMQPANRAAAPPGAAPLARDRIITAPNAAAADIFIASFVDVGSKLARAGSRAQVDFMLTTNGPEWARVVTGRIDSTRVGARARASAASCPASCASACAATIGIGSVITLLGDEVAVAAVRSKGALSGGGSDAAPLLVGSLPPTHSNLAEVDLLAAAGHLNLLHCPSGSHV